MSESTKQKAIIIPYLLVLLQGVLYGFGDPISKVAYEVMPVFSLLTVRYLIATVFMMLHHPGLRNHRIADAE